LGLNGLPIQAESAVVFQGGVCANTCVMPIVTLIQEFEEGECYNFWDAIQNVNQNFGWLNWTWNNEGACKASAVCLEGNLNPDTCNSGRIKVDGWVANDGGVSNSVNVRNWLDYYIDNGIPFTVIIYDIAGCNWESPPCHIPPSDKCGCKETGDGSPDNPAGWGYHVVGFAKFQPTGYFLASGKKGGNAYGDDGSTCVGPEETGGNRITGVFIDWVEGEVGNCTPVGNITAPRVTK
jgi:hypothetical protein